MLEDMWKKIPKIKNVLVDARSVIFYIYNHGLVLNMMRRLCGKELHRASDTRFRTYFYTLRSIYENRCYLCTLFVGEWWVKNRFSKEAGGIRTARIVAKQSFWDDLYFACQVMAPLVDVVRMVDVEEKPSMGSVYEAMDVAKEQIRKILEGSPMSVVQRVWKMIDERWNEQLHHPLHAAGFFLNPSIYYKQDPEEVERSVDIMGGFYTTIERMLP